MQSPLRWIVWPLLLGATLWLAGCVTVGVEFNQDALDQIKVGVTTTEEVRTLLGNPIRTGLEDGKLTWTYMRYKASLGGTVEGHDLVLRFDEKNRVIVLNYSSTDVGRTIRR